MDVELHRTDAIRPIADHRGWDELPVQGFTEEKGGPLAFIERPIGKIPQRRFAATGFVDAEHGHTLPNVYGGEKRVVRTPGNQATLEDTAAPQELTELVCRVGLQCGPEKRSRT